MESRLICYKSICQISEQYDFQDPPPLPPPPTPIPTFLVLLIISR